MVSQIKNGHFDYTLEQGFSVQMPTEGLPAEGIIKIMALI